jgi:hypothetical protein
MNQAYPWYAIVEGSDLQQGDLLEGCPVLIPSVTILEISEGNEYELEGYIQ